MGRPRMRGGLFGLGVVAASLAALCCAGPVIVTASVGLLMGCSAGVLAGGLLVVSAAVPLGVALRRRHARCGPSVSQGDQPADLAGRREGGPRADPPRAVLTPDLGPSTGSAE
jgi:hypothetical protein